MAGTTKGMFIWLIIRLIRLVFSAGTVFFSRLIIPAERGLSVGPTGLGG
jgi:hypothetical protein